MSRSYKRAVLKYAPTRGKPGKRFANRAVRRAKNLPNGCGYKRAFCSYDIHDAVVDMRFDVPDSWLPRGAKKTRAGWKIPK